MFDTNTAGRWVTGAMRLKIKQFFASINRGQQADGTSGAQTRLHVGPSCLPLDDILPAQAEDKSGDIGEELDDDAETQLPIPRKFPTTKTGFEKFELKLQWKIIIPQRYFDAIRNRALRQFADYEKRVVDGNYVAWLREHDHIGNPPAAGSLANGKHTSSRPAAN